MAMHVADPPEWYLRRREAALEQTFQILTSIVFLFVSTNIWLRHCDSFDHFEVVAGVAVSVFAGVSMGMVTGRILYRMWRWMGQFH